MNKIKSNNNDSFLRGIIIGCIVFAFYYCGFKICNKIGNNWRLKSMQVDIVDVMNVNINLNDVKNISNKYESGSKTIMQGKSYVVNDFQDFSNFLYNLKLEASRNEKLGLEVLTLGVILSNLNFQYLNSISNNLNNREYIEKISYNVFKISKNFINCYISKRKDGMNINMSKNLIQICLKDFLDDKNNSSLKFDSLNFKVQFDGKTHYLNNFIEYKNFLSDLIKYKNKDYMQEAGVILAESASFFLEVLRRDNYSYENSTYWLRSYIETFSCYFNKRKSTMSYQETLEQIELCAKEYVSDLMKSNNY